MSMNKTEIKNLLEEMQEELKNQDAEMKHQGMTHRITFWHHKNKGDDEQGDMYLSGDPTSTLDACKRIGMERTKAANRLGPNTAHKKIREIYIKSLGDYQVIKL